MDLIVHPGYCEEHSDTRHYVDEAGKCYGATMSQVEARGYGYARHIGGNWFRLQPRYPSRQDLAWEMAQDAHQEALALEAEADARSNNSFDNDVEF